MSNDKKKQPDEEEDIVSTAIGEFGRWQLLMTFLLSLFNIPCTWHIFAPTFHAAERYTWCARPEKFRSYDVSKWKNYTQPIDHCSIFNLSGVEMPSLPYLRNNSEISLIPCTEWEFAGEGNEYLLISVHLFIIYINYY